MPRSRSSSAAWRAEQGAAEHRAINRQLEQIAAQWRFARAGFSLADDSRFVPTVIVTTSDSLLRRSSS